MTHAEPAEHIGQHRQDPTVNSDAETDTREPDDLLKVAEVAAMMRVSRMTIYRLVDSGELTSFRVGRSVRIPARAVQALRGIDGE